MKPRIHNTVQSCSSVWVVFHRRYRQNPQGGLRVLKFGSGVSLRGALPRQQNRSALNAAGVQPDVSR